MATQEKQSEKSNVFRRSYSELYKYIKANNGSRIQITNELYSKEILAEAQKNNILDEKKYSSDATTELLTAISKHIEYNPLSFDKILNVFEKEDFVLKDIVSRMRQEAAKEIQPRNKLQIYPIIVIIFYYRI